MIEAAGFAAAFVKGSARVVADAAHADRSGRKTTATLRAVIRRRFRRHFDVFTPLSRLHLVKCIEGFNWRWF